MTRGGIRAGRVVALAAGGVAIMLAVLAAPASAASKRPDLVVTAARLTSKHYAFFGDEGAVIEFKATTKNVGKKGAGPTKTRLLFLAENRIVHVLAVNVPKLAVGQSDTSGKSGVGGTTLLPVGRYHIFVCADANDGVAESNENNNCKGAGRFDVIVRTWKGDVSGYHPLGSGGTSEESWSSPKGLEFTFQKGSNGVYTYLPKGSLHYKASGTSPFGGGQCTYSGEGDYDVTGKGELIINYRSATITEGTYGGAGDGEASYLVEAVCQTPYGTYTATSSSPQDVAWWLTGKNARTYTFSAGIVLHDHYDDTSEPSNHIHWGWDLTGQG